MIIEKTTRASRARRTRQIFGVVALVALTATACSGGSSGSQETSVVVDSPKLQQLKAEAGIETCVPGPGGGSLPDLTLQCLGGGPEVNLASLRGPMLINLWFSGCGPCRKEMPALQEFYDKHGTDVPVVGIDVENYPEAAISFAGMVGATYPQLADPGSYIFDQSELRLRAAFPQTILIDADGVVVAKQAGAFDSAAAIEDFASAAVDLR